MVPPRRRLQKDYAMTSVNAKLRLVYLSAGETDETR